jgi:hypothetical protein
MSILDPLYSALLVSALRVAYGKKGQEDRYFPFAILFCLFFFAYLKARIAVSARYLLLLAIVWLVTFVPLNASDHLLLFRHLVLVVWSFCDAGSPRMLSLAKHAFMLRSIVLELLPMFTLLNA